MGIFWRAIFQPTPGLILMQTVLNFSADTQWFSTDPKGPVSLQVFYSGLWPKSRNQCRAPLATGLSKVPFSNKAFLVFPNFIKKCRKTAQKLFMDNPSLVVHEKAAELCKGITI